MTIQDLITISDGSLLKSYSATSQGRGAGLFYLAGSYLAESNEFTLTDVSPIDSLGVANVSYAAHAFLVAGGAGLVSGGIGPVELVVSGTSITDDRIRTPGDSQIIVSDITTLALNQYVETSKKWLGQVTYTLQNAIGSTQTNFSFDFNVGFTKYEDFGNIDFILINFECVGLGGANDSNFNIRLLKHDINGWVYTPTNFVPGGTELLNMQTVHGIEHNAAFGEPLIFKVVGESFSINGSANEGVIIEITTGTNNTIQAIDCHIGVEV